MRAYSLLIAFVALAPALGSVDERVSNLEATLEAVLGRVRELEALVSDACCGTTGPKKSGPTRSDDPGEGVGIPPRVQRTLFETGDSRASTLLTQSSVQTQVVNATTIHVDTLFWRGREWGPGEPTFAPTPSPTVAPTFAPIPSPTVVPTAPRTLYFNAGEFTGWSGSTVTHCAGVWGPFGTELRANTAVFDLTRAPHAKVRITGSLRAYSTRDVGAEGPDKLFVDGTLRFATAPPVLFVYPGYFTSEAQMKAGCVSSSQSYTATLSNVVATPIGLGNSELSVDCPWMVTNSDYTDIGACYYNFDMTLAHTSSSLTLSFTSGIDQPASNEAWGIGNIVIEAMNE